MPRNSRPAADRVRELLDYDPETGLFTWKKSRGRVAAGQAAGWDWEVEPGRVYIGIGVDGKSYYAHDLAWLHVTGAWPTQMIDHKDRNGRNNRFLNLRDVSNALNQHNQLDAPKNSSTGLRGVSIRSRDSKFVAKIKVAGRHKHLGTFSDPQLAQRAYLDAKAELQAGYIAP